MHSKVSEFQATAEVEIWNLEQLWTESVAVSTGTEAKPVNVKYMRKM